MSDYEAALTTAAFFDTSNAAKLVLTGPDAPMFLGNLSTNDIKNLPLGGGCEAYFCDSRAKVQFQTWIYHILSSGEHALWIETTPGRNEALTKYLDRYLISERVEIADRTGDFGQFHLAGPQAKSLLEEALGNTLPDLTEFAHMEGTFGTHATCGIRRRDPLGLPGFDIVCLKEHGNTVRDKILATGAISSSPETYETLRIEAGTPLFGPDIDENRFVMEVGDAARAVSYSKGCYLGQEPIVMARDRAGHVNRAFLGLKVLEGGPLPSDTKLLRDGQEVGLVTSSCHSPRLGIPVALGYLRWKHQERGIRLEAETASGRQTVEVVGRSPVANASRSDL
jgi:folate-binding protein YgfZ